jgi:hypothetical protein
VISGSCWHNMVTAGPRLGAIRGLDRRNLTPRFTPPRNHGSFGSLAPPKWLLTTASQSRHAPGPPHLSPLTFHFSPLLPVGTRTQSASSGFIQKATTEPTANNPIEPTKGSVQLCV